MQRKPLPPNEKAGPFATGASDLPRNRLRASDLDRSVHGVRVVREDRPMSLADRCRLFAVRIRTDAVFSHTTSALLWGAPLDFKWENSTAVHMAVTAPESAPHAQGIIGHALDLVTADVTTHIDLRVTSPARTWVDLATMLSLEDLVAVGDFFIHHSHPLTTLAELAAAIDRMLGQRGVRLARLALPMLSSRAESRPESRLRVILELGGIRKPRINHELVDTETGKRVRPDFMFLAEKLILEYQGDYHRTKEQWRKDMTRREKLQADGWYVMEVNANDLRDADELIRRIQRVLAGRR